MVKVIEGQLVAKGRKFGIVASRFNDFITKKLLEGAVDSLLRHGAVESDIEVAWVPGSFELPAVAGRLARSKRFDAVICLGTIVRGSTPHFDYVAAECAKGVASVSITTGVPTIFGVITADNLEQAIERAGTKSGNRGRQAADNAIEMANLYKRLK